MQQPWTVDLAPFYHYYDKTTTATITTTYIDNTTTVLGRKDATPVFLLPKLRLFAAATCLYWYYVVL